MKKSLRIALLFAFLPAGYMQAQVKKPATTTDPKMTAFVSNLMSKMTIDEKIGQLNLLTPGGGLLTGSVVNGDVEAKMSKGGLGGLFGVIGVDKIRQAQQLAVEKSRLKIPLIFGSDIIHGYKTTFPIPLGLSCSWDTAMIRNSASIAAAEATADGLNWAFSPMVDIARDPRWGRIAEGNGEDPFLGSAIAKAMVQGYQGNSYNGRTVMACVKHFALYGAAEAGRDYNTTDMSLQRMYNEYLPPYKAALDAGCGSVMSSFNDINGIPATVNKWLLTDLLRKQWGFTGFVVTDYTGINETIDHGMGNLQEVSALALKAGVDMDMVGEGFYTTLKKSLTEKKIMAADIDAACRRVLEAKYKLGLFADPYKYCDADRAKAEVLSNEKRLASRTAAEHSMVLLKNDNGLLPLKKNQTIALIGPLANDKANMLGTWAVSGDNTTSIPVLDGIKNMIGADAKVTFAKGANLTDDSAMAVRANVFGEKAFKDGRSPQTLMDEAIALARNSDVIVAVVGESSEFSGESASRTEISIPESQRKLIAALSATGKPLVLVIMSGRPLTIEKEVMQSTAVLQAWFGGHESGNAIANVLYGNYNPSGKTTITFPRNVGQIPIYYSHKNTGRPAGANWQKFRSNYIDAPNTPLYPFGYGLSYTTFSYGGVQLSKNSLGTGGSIQASVTVTNTGNYDGEEVVQLYIQDMVGSSSRPVKELKGFQKIMLRKGESRTITFTIAENDLMFYNNDLKWVSEAGDFKVFIGSNSTDVKEASFKLTK
jgi:beta-glucosidase